MTLEQMQKQGRAKMNRPAHGICFEQDDILDQHTANTWKAAHEMPMELFIISLNRVLRAKTNPKVIDNIIEDLREELKYLQQHD